MEVGSVYGKHWLNGQGHLFVVYPMTASFNRPLPVFAYSEQLRLWVLPFDLQTGVLVGNPLFGDVDRPLDAAA